MQMPSPAASGKVTFGLFEADLQTGELWKAGFRIKLQSQPFKVLTALLERPGQIVTREQLQDRLWGRDTIVDFDHSLGTAVNKIREALGDSAENPRFVETLARRGYRFIAPVSMVATSALDENAPVRPDLLHRPEVVRPPEVLRGFEEPIAATLQPPIQVGKPPGVNSADGARRPWSPARNWAIASGAICAVVAATIAGFLFGKTSLAPMPRIDRLTHTGRIAPGVESMETLPASVTDGLRIFTTVISAGRTELAQVDVHTGDVQRFELPSDVSSPMLGDISPDGASLLVRSHLSPESEQPLWVVPTGGGSALRLSNILAHDATWMPDSKSVLYAAGNQLMLLPLQGESPHVFAELPGRAFWLRWSPDATKLRFTLSNPVDHTLSLWQVDPDGKGAEPVLNHWPQATSTCCGTWTGDGKYFIFQANERGNSDLWRLRGKDAGTPERITNGPLSFLAPTTARIGHRIYFLGLEAQSALLQLDPERKEFVPAQEFLAEANRLEYSRDFRWVIWTDQKGLLWRARADGSERIQVTPDSLEVFTAHWSPDGSQIALMARESGKAWQIYTISPEGGTPVRLLADSRNAADPSWAPDGQRLVFGRVTDLMGREDGVRALELLDLRTGRTSTIPHSEGLFSPRWSPDGRYIAAITLDQRTLRLLDLQAQTWRTVAETTVADPVWSPDSKAIFFHADRADTQPIYRWSLPDGSLQMVANLSNFVDGETADYFFCGLTPDAKPVVRSRIRTGDIYTLDLDGRQP